jgi:hypothetical protein
VTVSEAVSASLSEPYVPVVLEPSPYMTTYWHCDLEQPLPSTPSCAHAAAPQEKGTYVLDLLGSKSDADEECTHDTSLPVSMIMVCFTGGEPRSTVMTYSSVSRADPRLVGTVTSDDWSPLARWLLENLRWTYSARSWSRRSSSAKVGFFSDGTGEHGPCRWFSGTVAPLDKGGLTA